MALVGHYKLDEVIGTIITDSSGSVDGTAVGGVVLGDLDAPGLSRGTSMTFDGVNDGILLGTTDFDFERTDTFSISAWVNVSSFAIGGQIFGRIETSGNFRGWRIFYDTAGIVVVQLFSSAVNRLKVSSPASSLTTGWHHITVTYSGSSTAAGAKIYIDSVLQVNTVSNDTLSATIVSAGQEATVGMFGNQAGTYFNGNIDDVRIYNTELTSGEVLTLYQAIVPTNLVGYYKLNETAGATVNSVIGPSGTYAGSPSLAQVSVPGIVEGTSVAFDGTDDVANFGGSDFDFERTDTFSLSTWVKIPVGPSTGAIIAKQQNSGDFRGYGLLSHSSGEIRLQLRNTGGNELTVATVATFDDNAWHHAVATYDGSSAASGVTIYVDGQSETLTTVSDTLSATISIPEIFRIGARDTVAIPFPGSLDEVRIYDTELSAGDVTNLYNAVIPSSLVGYYKLDEASGTTAVAQIGPTGTYVGSPTLSGTRADGLISGTSVLFDGVNDTVDFGTSDFAFERTDSFSIALWIKTTTTGSSDTVSKSLSVSPFTGWVVGPSSTTAGAMQFDLVNSSVATNRLKVINSVLINDGNWHHVAITYDGTSLASGVSMYVDGVLDGSTTAPNDTLSASILAGAAKATIGSRDSALAFFPGDLDDVRIYDIELSSDGVSELYLTSEMLSRAQSFLETINDLMDFDAIETPTLPFRPEVLENIGVTLNTSAFGTSTLSLVDAVDFSETIGLSIMESLIDQLSISDTTLVDIPTQTLVEIIELTLNQVITGTLTVFTPPETLELNSTVISDVLRVLKEICGVGDTLNLQATYNHSVKDIINLSSLFAFFFDGLAQETVEVNDIIQGRVAKLESLVDSLTASGIVSDTYTALNLIVDAANFISTAFSVSTATVMELIDLSDIIVLSKIIALSSVSEDVSVSELELNNVVFSLGLNEGLTIDDSLSAFQVLQNLIEEGIGFLFTTDSVGNEYEGWVMNTDTFSLWNYNNFNFNSIDQIGQTTIMASPTGLYEQEGALDEQAFIISKIQTAAMDLGNSNRKQMHKVYLGMHADKELILIVKTDEKVEATYRSQIQLSNSDTPFIDLGKGLVGRTWQFELQDKDATEFDLTDIELYPIVFSRKRR